jgi:hypothetical protein
MDVWVVFEAGAAGALAIDKKRCLTPLPAETVSLTRLLRMCHCKT